MSRSQEEQPNYSEKYSDDCYEYRHVHLPKSWVKLLPDDRHLLTEAEWRALGVCQSRGWEHYMHHEPEPGILLFRRLLNYQPNPSEDAQLQMDIKRHQIDIEKKRAALKAAGQLK